MGCGGPNLLLEPLKLIILGGHFGFSGISVPGFNTRITRNNFRYRSLLPEAVIGLSGFGFFGYGFGFFEYRFRVICPAILKPLREVM